MPLGRLPDLKDKRYLPDLADFQTWQFAKRKDKLKDNNLPDVADFQTWQFAKRKDQLIDKIN
jgi:hypothetical protein